MALGCALFAVACASPSDPAPDAGTSDSTPDAAEILDAHDPLDAADTDTGTVATTEDAGFADAEVPDVASVPDGGVIEVTVTLDGVLAPNVLVGQGGAPSFARTDENGRATLALDPAIQNFFPWIFASHPEARIRGWELSGGETEHTIELERFDDSDNEAYPFSDPGTPDDRGDTSSCAHCHHVLNDDWYASVHRTSASNPLVQDMYAGVATSIAGEDACVAAGGEWLEGLQPGTRQPSFRCYVGDGALSRLNPECVNSNCDTQATRYGDCADCHAPGINGRLGGRDLLEATDRAYDYGVHCDVCHRVESLDLAAEAGVAGRLRMLRPSETAPFGIGGGGFLPMTFGPSHDSPNPRMGSVQRDHFRQSELCAGCHQLEQRVLVPGETLNGNRWPSGRLPIHSTYDEWRAGPFVDAAPCQSCHMAPDPQTLNGANVERFGDAVAGFIGGPIRPPGSVRKHNWVGPRAENGRLLELAAGLFLNKRIQGDRLMADVTVRNVGCGHALPTGEPLRSVVLAVEAKCGAQELRFSGGAVVPDFGGWLDRKAAGDDWSVWPGAQVGDVIRVIRRTGDFVDYEGFGRFGDGSFDASEKGLPVEELVGTATITAVQGDQATFSGAVPNGDVAYRVRGTRLPADGEAAIPLAGAPGFGFARVLADAEGRRMAPHFAAVDVVSDNRLMPQQSWTSSFEFVTTCPDPELRAVLYYVPYPHWLAEERGWTRTAKVMMEVQR